MRLATSSLGSISIDHALAWEVTPRATLRVDYRDLDTLRAAGRHARICPYEITRTALAYQDVCQISGRRNARRTLV